MQKTFLTYITVFTILLVVVGYVHIYLVLNNAMDFPLRGMYFYHFIFSLTTCLLIAYLAFEDLLQQQLALVYLGALFVKIIFFVVLFKNFFLGDVQLPQTDRVSMLIPFGLFLATEVIFLSKILKKMG